MRTREELIAFLRKVTALERAGGFQDRAVFGGLGKLAGNVRAWGRSPAGDRSLADAAAALLEAYGAGRPQERTNALESLERVLSGESDAWPKPSGGPAPREPAPRTRDAGPAGRRPSPQAPRSSPPATGPDAPVTSLKGIKDQTAKLLANLGVRTVEDLLWLLPDRHENRGLLTPIAKLEGGKDATVRGRVTAAAKVPFGLRKERLEVTLEDSSGRIDAIWFNQPWLAEKLSVGRVATVHGAVRDRAGTLQLQSPELEPDAPDGPGERVPRWVPLYPLTAGLFQRGLRRMTAQAVDVSRGWVTEPLPGDLVGRLELPGRHEALAQTHAPTSREQLDRALARLRFEELFFLELAVAVKRHLFTIARSGVRAEDSAGLLNRLRNRLPFRLTGAQERVVAEVLEDMRSPRAMARLVQGDVGAGKTVVALAALVASSGGGWQGALMAPTEILAGQHYLSIRRLCEELGVRVELVVGRQSASERRAALESIASGEAAIAIGTHALLEGEVQFQRLGLVVIDEQHRFGVNQRTCLKLKGESPNLLVMTATPIPRTLALTLYGDLDLSIVDEMPPGRQPIRSRALPMEKLDEVYRKIAEEVALGRQAYIVCPLVEESETLEAEAAEETHRQVREERLPGLRVELLHGRMPGIAKAAVMDRMRRGEADVLVATTVIEVGVDIPNATVMAVLNAERFGLAQLHQLRGRIGRGAHRSTFFAVVASRSKEVRRRMRVLEETSDGFVVAEKDLELRGPGEFFGTRQSGLDSLRVASLPRDLPLLERARREAFALIERDPALESPELVATRSHLMKKYGEFVHRRH